MSALGPRDAPRARIRGVGIDAVEVERFRSMLGRRPGLASRLFTDAECALAASRSDPVPALAARFAAKEAAMKALGVGIGAVAFHDLEVVRADSGAPSMHLSGRAVVLAERLGVTRLHVSLTHTRTIASAVVLAD